MNEHEPISFNAGVASAIALAEQAAVVIEQEGDMAGPRDPVSVEALRTFAQEAANLFRTVPTIGEDA